MRRGSVQVNPSQLFMPDPSFFRPRQALYNSALPTAPTSGTWTPSPALGANAAAATGILSTYLRSGVWVSFFGKINIDPTLTLTQTIVALDLPIASNFANDYEACGTLTSYTTGAAGTISADTAAKKLSLTFYPFTDAGNQACFFHGGYRII